MSKRERGLIFEKTKLGRIHYPRHDKWTVDELKGLEKKFTGGKCLGVGLELRDEEQREVSGEGKNSTE